MKSDQNIEQSVELDAEQSTISLYGSELFCGWCNGSFLCPVKLRIHFHIEHQPTCPCGRTFDGRKSLFDHVRRSTCNSCRLPHPYDWTDFDGLPIFTDEICTLRDVPSILQSASYGKALVDESKGINCANCKAQNKTCSSCKNKDDTLKILQKKRSRMLSPSPIIGSGSNKRMHLEEEASAKENGSVCDKMSSKRLSESSLLEVRRADAINTAKFYKNSSEEESKPLPDKQNKKIRKSEIAFIRNCFTPMSGLLKCRLCSHVYARWKSAYRHVRSVHNTELKKSLRKTNAIDLSFNTAQKTSSKAISGKMFAGVIGKKLAKSSELNSTKKVNDEVLVKSDSKLCAAVDQQTADASGRRVGTKTCQLCRIVFKNLFCYLAHLKQKNRCADVHSYMQTQYRLLPDGKGVECLICKVVKPERSSFYKHIRSKHDVQQMQLDSKRELPSAGKSAQSQSKFFCQFCRRSFKHIKSLSQHKVSCSYRLMGKSSLVAHKSKGSDAVAGHTGAKNVSKVTQLDCSITCRYCSFHFASKSSCARHEIDCKLKRNPIKVEEIRDYDDESADKANNVARCVSQNDMFQCSLCDFVAKTEGSITMHIRFTTKVPHNANTIKMIGKQNFDSLHAVVTKLDEGFQCTFCKVLIRGGFSNTCKHLIRCHSREVDDMLCSKVSKSGLNLPSVVPKKQLPVINTRIKVSTKSRGFNAVRSFGVAFGKRGFTFQTRSGYVRHRPKYIDGTIKRRQPKDSQQREELAYINRLCKPEPDGYVECTVCNRKLMKRSVYRHIRDVHGIPKDMESHMESLEVPADTPSIALTDGNVLT